MKVNIIQLTQNTRTENYPTINGNNVVWSGVGGSDNGSDKEIFYWNGNTIRQLTQNTRTEDYATISGSNVVWQGTGGSDNGSDTEIFYWNGNSTRQLTQNTRTENFPLISGNNVVWQGIGGSDNGSDTEIFYWNGNSIRQLTQNTRSENYPAISGTKVVWSGTGGSDNGSDTEIFYWDGTTTRQLTQNARSENYPTISGSNVVWQGTGGSDNGSDTEIFYWDGTTTRQLTQNTTNENYPTISGSNLVWQGTGGSDGGSDTEIFYWDGTTTRQLTQNTTNENYPNINGTKVVWQGTGGSDNGSDTEIFLAEIINNSEPTDLSLSNNTILENIPIAVTVGTLSTTDPDALDTFSYTLVSGTGSDNNNAFTISGNQLIASNAFNFESQSSYSIRVRTTDSQGASFEKILGINVIDIDESGSLSVSDSSVTEGASGIQNANFVVSLNKASLSYVRVDLNTTNYTAGTSDYQPVSTTVTFNPGETTRTVTVPVFGDATIEANDRFLVKLTNPLGATVDNSLAVGTIKNDDFTVLAININDITITEGSSGTNNAQFTVSLSGLSSQPVSFSYNTANYSARSGTDFDAIATTRLTFTPGETTKTITVGIQTDTVPESNEKFLVSLSNATNATWNNRIGVGTILNDDGIFSPPLISIADASIFEGNTGSQNLDFTVTLSASSLSTVKVNYNTNNSTAIAGSDYQAIPTTTLTFNPGETTKTISVPVNGDTSIEGNERFFLNLSRAVGGNLYDPIATATILSDDTLPIITLSDSTVTEGNSGNVNSNFVVGLSQAFSKTVTVNYKTVHGTATSIRNLSDYVGIGTTTLTFNPGETSKTISVKVTGDSQVETTEIFFLPLFNPVNGILGDNLGVGTILNDDLTAPSVAFNTKSKTDSLLSAETEVNSLVNPASIGDSNSLLLKSNDFLNSLSPLISIPSEGKQIISEWSG